MVKRSNSIINSYISDIQIERMDSLCGFTPVSVAMAHDGMSASLRKFLNFFLLYEQIKRRGEKSKLLKIREIYFRPKLK